MTIKEIKPTSTAEQQNDSSPPSSSKEQKPLTDEEIHINDTENIFHSEEEYDTVDEEFELEW